MYGRIDSPERGRTTRVAGIDSGGPKRIAGRRILSRPSAWRRRARDNSVPAFSLCKRPVGFLITLRPFPLEYERVATQDRRERPTASQNPKLIDVERKGRNRAYLHREFHVHCWCLVILEARIASAELIDQRAARTAASARLVRRRAGGGGQTQPRSDRSGDRIDRSGRPESIN